VSGGPTDRWQENWIALITKKWQRDSQWVPHWRMNSGLLLAVDLHVAADLLPEIVNHGRKCALNQGLGLWRASRHRSCNSCEKITKDILLKSSMVST